MHEFGSGKVLTGLSYVSMNRRVEVLFPPKLISPASWASWRAAGHNEGKDVLSAGVVMPELLAA